MEGNIGRRTRFVAAALLTAALALIGVAAPAVATATEGGPASAAAEPAVIGPQASKSCVVPLSSCNTGSVQATTAGTVQYSVGSSAVGCSFRVKDVNTGVSVRSGRIYFSGSGTVGGLTNWYRLELYNCFTGHVGVIVGR